MGTRVYIGRIPRRCSRRDVEKFFRGYGKMRDIVLMATYGFVEFDSSRDAEDAVYDLNGKDLLGERVIIEHAKLPPKDDRRRRERTRGMGSRYGPPVRTEYRIIVENLSSRISWQDLKDLMRKAGDVTFADAHNARRNEGVVEFSSYSDLRAAIDKYDGYELYGRKLKVYEDRARSHSRSRSHSDVSKSYSRSRSCSHGRSRRSRRHRKHSSSHSRSRSYSDSSRSSSRHEKKRRRRHHRSRTPSHSGDDRKEDRRSATKSRSRTPSPGGRKSPSAEHIMSDHQENGDDSPRSKHSASPARSKSRSRSPDPDNDAKEEMKDNDHYSDRRSISRSRSRSGDREREDEEMDRRSD